MSRRLSGLNPLSYLGVEPLSPPQLVVYSPHPVATNTNFNLGTLWLASTDQTVWMLTSLAGGVATWIEIGTPAGVGASQFMTDAGLATAVGPLLNIMGGLNINTAGAGNTVTINIDDNPVFTSNALILNTSNNTVPPMLIFEKSRSMAGAPVITGDGIGQLVFDGYDGATFSPGATITGLVNGVVAPGQMPTELVFSTAPAIVSAPINRMVILSTGAVFVNPPDSGIGFTSNSPLAGGTAIQALTGNIIVSAGNIGLPDTVGTVGGILTINNNPFLWSPGGVARENVVIGGVSGNGTMTGTANIACGFGIFTALTTGSNNIGIGQGSGSALTTGNSNFIFGIDSLNTSLVANSNVIIGNGVGNAITTGSFNIILGGTGLGAATTASNNIVLGYGGLNTILTGTGNLILGNSGGSAYVGAESNNLLIYNAGTAAETNAIHIGTQGAGAGQQNTCYIAGITGVAVANSAAVLLNTLTGQLGTVISSRRYKKNIEPMTDESNGIYALRPVTFNYVKDSSHKKNIGLIAEEVAQVMPSLVVYDKEEQPETVMYHDLPILLLNEIQKLNKRIEWLENTWSYLHRTLQTEAYKRLLVREGHDKKDDENNV